MTYMRTPLWHAALQTHIRLYPSPLSPEKGSGDKYVLDIQSWCPQAPLKKQTLTSVHVFALAQGAASMAHCRVVLYTDSG